MELQLWGIRGFADHSHGNERKQNASTILCALWGVSGMFISDSSTYAPDESRLFWSWEKPEYPHLEPHAVIKVAQVQEFPVYICDDVTNVVDVIFQGETILLPFSWIMMMWPLRNNYLWKVMAL